MEARAPHQRGKGSRTVCIDAFGQLEKGAEWKLVRRIREAKGVVLGRDTGPCGEEKADSGPHKVLEHFGIGHSCRTLRQKLRKSPVVIRSVEVVYDQKNLRAELCQPVQIKAIERADIRAVHGKGVAEADRRNRAHKVAGIDGVNTGESVGARGKDGGERCFAACAFAADEEGRRGVVKKSTDLIQLLLAAKEQARWRRERCRCNGRSRRRLCFPDLDAQKLDRGRGDQTAKVLAAVTQECGEDQPGECRAQMPAQSVCVSTVSLRCFILLQTGADIHEDVIPVLRIHLRRQPVLLIGAGLQKC